MRRSGRSVSICAARRREPVPTRAPSGSVSNVVPGLATSASRTSARGRQAANSVSAKRAGGASLAEWTAASIRPSSSASSNARTKHALSADLGERCVGFTVAAALDDHRFRLHVLLGQGVADQLGLRQRQNAAARAQPQTARHGCSWVNGSSAGGANRGAPRRASSKALACPSAALRDQGAEASVNGGLPIVGGDGAEAAATPQIGAHLRHDSRQIARCAI